MRLIMHALVKRVGPKILSKKSIAKTVVQTASHQSVRKNSHSFRFWVAIPEGINGIIANRIRPIYDQSFRSQRWVRFHYRKDTLVSRRFHGALVAFLFVCLSCRSEITMKSGVKVEGKTVLLFSCCSTPRRGKGLYRSSQHLKPTVYPSAKIYKC